VELLGGYGAVVSSCATTINVLDGLLAYEQAAGGSTETIAARRRGEEYLLERRLFRRKSSGDIIDESWLQFSYPTRWHYDILRALTTSALPTDCPTRGWRRRSRCFGPSDSPTGRGCGEHPPRSGPLRARRRRRSTEPVENAARVTDPGSGCG
jgi:hypothetical protein